ncbi:MAG TPA: cytochrome c [Nitrospira sp.]|nr:cytochrome c [Nitrospira sp.]
MRRKKNIAWYPLMAGLALVLSGPYTIVASPATDSPTGDDSKGKKIFARHCAGCHGSQGKGDGYLLLGPDPANLTRPATKKKSDATLLSSIHEGKPNMPSWKNRLSAEESRAVLAYVRTLEK